MCIILTKIYHFTNRISFLEILLFLGTLKNEYNRLVNKVRQYSKVISLLSKLHPNEIKLL